MAGSRSWRADGTKRPVLVATDCLSEGVNLQDQFQAVVHYDLAWNPTRHEQREGRVDRFGQTARTVRAVTIYGADNGIDGIVLNVLLRKHEQIRKALGISVPVPDRSDDVCEAILEGLLLRDAQSEQLMLDFGHEHRDDLHKEWESAAEKEREFFTKYRQAGIHPEEVSRELAEMRAIARHRVRRARLHRGGAPRAPRRRDPAAGRVQGRDGRAARRPGRRPGAGAPAAAAVPRGPADQGPRRLPGPDRPERRGDRPLCP